MDAVNSFAAFNKKTIRETPARRRSAAEILLSLGFNSPAEVTEAIVRSKGWNRRHPSIIPPISNYAKRLVWACDHEREYGLGSVLAEISARDRSVASASPRMSSNVLQFR